MCPAANWADELNKPVARDSMALTLDVYHSFFVAKVARLWTAPEQLLQSLARLATTHVSSKCIMPEADRSFAGGVSHRIGLNRVQRPEGNTLLKS